MRFQQSRKQKGEMAAIDEGRRSECSDKHPSNAYRPTIDSREPGSNGNSESFLQRLKQKSAIAATDEGMQID
jgi:hypothetical protein